MIVLIQIGAGSGGAVGPFNLTANAGSVIPATATRAELVAGLEVTVDNAATTVTITSTGVCTGTSEIIPITGIPVIGAWSTGGALITARYGLAGAGTQNAALAFGGLDSGFSAIVSAEEYNGSSWSVGGALSTARASLAGAGTQNAGLAFGGSNPNLSCTEEYDGSSWSAGGA